LSGETHAVDGMLGESGGEMDRGQLMSESCYTRHMSHCG